MLAVIACLAGIAFLLAATEYLGSRKILRGEYRRKFLHITAGSFIAFWPWIVGWDAIRVLGLVMLLVIAAARYTGFLSYHGYVRRVTYGDIFLAAAIPLCSFISSNKIFFALAILQVALADGVAAVAGTNFGQRWGYRVFDYRKTLVGSMVFWITSAVILAVGLLLSNMSIQAQDYLYILLLVPPALTFIEAISLYGIDNLLIPVLTVLVLQAFIS